MFSETNNDFVILTFCEVALVDLELSWIFLNWENVVFGPSIVPTCLRRIFHDTSCGVFQFPTCWATIDC